MWPKIVKTVSFCLNCKISIRVKLLKLFSLLALKLGVVLIQSMHAEATGPGLRTFFLLFCTLSYFILTKENSFFLALKC